MDGKAQAVMRTMSVFRTLLVQIHVTLFQSNVTVCQFFLTGVDCSDESSCNAGKAMPQLTGRMVHS